MQVKLSVKIIEKRILIYFVVNLKSITKDSEEMTNFISVFIEVHGELPAFNIFESCERMEKRYRI